MHANASTNRNPLRKLWAATVWAPGAISERDRRFRGVFQWVLPLTDVFFLWFGVAGWFNGIATVQEASSVSWQSWWSFGISVVAAFALIGVSFPQLWWVELAAKAPLIGLVSVYIVIFLINGTENPLVQATAGLVCILILLPIWRLFDLGILLRKAQVASRAART